MLSLKEVCPQDVLGMFRKDLDRLHWQQWFAQQPEREELAPTPLIEAARQALKSTGKGHGAHAARKAVLHGSWTQKDLAGIGRADTEVCQACEAEEGTAHHRYYVCQHVALRDLRWQAADPTWATVVAASKLHMKWTRGLVRDPSVDWAFEPWVGEVHWELEEQGDPYLKETHA